MTKEKITRSELKEKRTANRKVFENQDHSRTVEIYMEPVHYEDEDGSWKEMLAERETENSAIIKASWRFS